MKIAIVAGPFVPVPPVKYGGTERVIGHLIQGLQELGHEVLLIGPGDSNVSCTLLPSVDAALSFPRHKSGIPAHEKLVEKALDTTLHLVDSIKDEVDIIHSHDFDLLSFIN